MVETRKNLKVWDKESEEIFEVAKINFETKEVSYEHSHLIGNAV